MNEEGGPAAAQLLTPHPGRKPEKPAQPSIGASSAPCERFVNCGDFAIRPHKPAQESQEHDPAHRRYQCMTLCRYDCAALLMLFMGATLPCAAQDTPLQDTPLTRGQNACSLGQRPSGEQTLSDKLERTDGIICPPDIDPNIKAPTPQGGGKMPVIPPPGSPGGDPTVRPK
jgi:hypothetical protein